jgi:DNA-binding transcriptional MerR regulator
MYASKSEVGRPERALSPALVCSIFDINKSTLLRWEREGILPPARRDVLSRQNERRYTVEDVKAIAEKTSVRLKHQIDQLTKDGERQAQSNRAVRADADTLSGLRALFETYSLHKFVAGKPIGLVELRQYEVLLPSTVTHLVRVALELYDPAEPIFADIMEVVAQQSRKLVASQP